MIVENNSVLFGVTTFKLKAKLYHTENVTKMIRLHIITVEVVTL